MFVCLSVCMCVTSFPMLLEGIKESIYCPQTSSIQFLEEASTGQYVGAIPWGPFIRHTDLFIPPLEIGENWI